MKESTQETLCQKFQNEQQAIITALLSVLSLSVFALVVLKQLKDLNYTLLKSFPLKPI